MNSAKKVELLIEMENGISILFQNGYLMVQTTAQSDLTSWDGIKARSLGEKLTVKIADQITDLLDDWVTDQTIK